MDSPSTPEIDRTNGAGSTSPVIDYKEARGAFKRIVCPYASAGDSLEHRVQFKRTDDLAWTGACAGCRAYVTIPSPFSEEDKAAYSTKEDWARFVFSDEGIAKMMASVARQRAEWRVAPAERDE